MACRLEFTLPKVTTPHVVAIPRGDTNADRIVEMRDWLKSEDHGATGFYSYHTTSSRPFTTKMLMFCFTDSDTAFHFKMVFG